MGDIPQHISPQEGERQGQSAGFCHLEAEEVPLYHHSEAPCGNINTDSLCNHQQMACAELGEIKVLENHLREVRVVKLQRVPCPGSLKARPLLVAPSLWKKRNASEQCQCMHTTVLVYNMKAD